MKKLKKTSDEELLNLYQSNSEENLLNILLQRHMPQIRQNVRSLVCNKEDVEDLCQDIYSRILIKLRQGYYSNGHIQAWIYRIVQNYVYSFYRKKKHEFITQELTDLNIGDTWSDTIKEEKEKERILYVLMSILEKEPPQIKQIIKMHFYMEMTYMQISIIRKTKCFDFWERNVLFPKTKRSFFRTPKHPLPCPFPLNFSLLIITKKFGNLAKNRYICIV